jgi:Holliday junction resolvasome RuvABC endonuclease subunit
MSEGAVLGLDAATNTGWGVVSCDPLPRALSWGVVGTQWEQIRDLIAELAPMPIVQVVIETPYVDKDPSVTIKLARIVGRWEQECDRAGLPVVLATASVWQVAMLSGLITARSPRAVRKRAARQWVSSVYRVSAREDEADGLVIATWGARTMLHRSRISQAIRGGSAA